MTTRRTTDELLPFASSAGLLDDGRLFRGEPQIGHSRTESSGDSVLCNAPSALSECHEGEGRRQGGLLRVEVEKAQYWEDRKPKILQFAEIVVGAVTGHPPKSRDERKLDFEP